MLDLANLIIYWSLDKLVRLGRIRPKQVNNKWSIKISREKTTDKGLIASVGLDAQNRCVIYLPDNLEQLTLKSLIFVLAHECVHVAQFCCGDLIPEAGFMIWRGQRYITASVDNADYAEQPWEVEAFSLQESIQDYLIAQCKASNLPIDN